MQSNAASLASRVLRIDCHKVLEQMVLPRGRMSMCITQPMLFSPLCFGHLILAPLSTYSETYSPRHNEVVVRKSAWPSAKTKVSLSCLLYNEPCPWIRPYKTEVHVLPANDPKWSCGPGHLGGDRSASEPSVNVCRHRKKMNLCASR